MRRPSLFGRGVLLLGFAFLYLPLSVLVVYSFNASRLVTIWGGWSTQWYGAILRDRALLDAAWTSLRVAVLSATGASVLGMGLALALTRGGPRRNGMFRGRTLLSALLYVPIVMPDVITGLALLLLFVALGSERGVWTVALAHTTLATCFVTVVLRARLADLDRSLEEAAQDLGATPARAFASVTLPIVFPAVASAWMLAFTLSLDDLVIASFTTGPGATTLPIRIYSDVRLGVKPEINAICTIVIAIVTLAVVAGSLLTRRAERGRATT